MYLYQFTNSGCKDVRTVIPHPATNRHKISTLDGEKKDNKTLFANNVKIIFLQHIYLNGQRMIMAVGRRVNCGWYCLLSTPLCLHYVYVYINIMQCVQPVLSDMARPFCSFTTRHNNSHYLNNMIEK